MVNLSKKLTETIINPLVLILSLTGRHSDTQKNYSSILKL